MIRQITEGRLAGKCIGNSFLDVEVLGETGVTDLWPYGGAGALEYDIFVAPPLTSTAHREPTRESPC